MDEKYYTPKIEEFHVGFECEFQGIDCNWTPTGWDKHVVVQTPREKKPGTWQLDFDVINSVYNGMNIEQFFRVKYLDREDIESLGLTHIGGKLDEKVNQKYISKTKKGYYLHLTVTHFSFGSVVTINTSVKKDSIKTLVIHTITIKNKSELKNILKQLCIF